MGKLTETDMEQLESFLNQEVSADEVKVCVLGQLAREEDGIGWEANLHERQENDDLEQVKSFPQLLYRHSSALGS